MPQPFKFRYVNQIVGSFVLLTTLLIVGSLVLIAQSQRWFTASQAIKLKIPGGASTDLHAGADVMIGGTIAGTVQSVDTDTSEPLDTIAVLAIPTNFMASIRANSKVEIEKGSA